MVTASGSRAASDVAQDVRPRPDRQGTMPERLAYLFATVRAPGGKPYSAVEVARWIKSHRESGMSATYISKLLQGTRQEASQRYARDLADFFGVDVSFFWDDDPAELTDAALDALALSIRMRDDDVRSLLRRVTELPPSLQSSLSGIVDHLLTTAGKDPDALRRDAGEI